MSLWNMMRGDVICVFQNYLATRSVFEILAIYLRVTAIDTYIISRFLLRYGWRYAQRVQSFLFCQYCARSISGCVVLDNGNL
ncbi:MAG: hypothetical protein HRT83_06040 [Hyphomicrobiaceae bacterium]|nr:hypothetical protein [Hyphomicrobiaceae bacterium]